MRKLFICLFTLFTLVYSSQAQDTSDNKFLFNSEKLQLNTFYLELSPVSVSTLNNQSVSVSALSAGFILNRKFTLSFFMGFSPKVNLIPVPEYLSETYIEWLDAGVELDKLSADTEFLYVDYKHSGLKFGYLHNTEKTVFWRASLALGFIGGLTLSENKTFMGIANNQVYKEKVFTVEPELGLGVNLLPWWRIFTDVGYRFLNADTRIMSTADANSYTFSLTFGFGRFNQ